MAAKERCFKEWMGDGKPNASVRRGWGMGYRGGLFYLLAFGGGRLAERG